MLCCYGFAKLILRCVLYYNSFLVWHRRIHRFLIRTEAKYAEQNRLSHHSRPRNRCYSRPLGSTAKHFYIGLVGRYCGVYHRLDLEHALRQLINILILSYGGRCRGIPTTQCRVPASSRCELIVLTRQINNSGPTVLGSVPGTVSVRLMT